MATALRPAIVLIALFTLLTGFVLPLGFTAAATMMAPSLAGGSMITRNGVIVGSSLIGQAFASGRYFHSRPSATTAPDPKDATKTIAAADNADNSAASNYAATSKALVDRVRADIAANGFRQTGPAIVPADMVTTSASGLDPDISPENAAQQASRVAAARHLPLATVQALVAAHTEPRLFGVLGEVRVNVLRLNIALDDAGAH